VIRAVPAVITASLNEAIVTLQTEVKYGVYLSLAAMPFKRIRAPGSYAHLHNLKRKFCNAVKSQRYLTEGSCGARIPFYKPDSYCTCHLVAAQAFFRLCQHMIKPH